ncbi:MAG: hypothetical protein U0572_13240 [Phycisphaerales bacterium]
MHNRTSILAALCAAAIALGCTAGASSPLSAHADPPTAQAKFTKETSLTILPTVLAGQPVPQVGEVVGMFLERGGMTNLELSSADFHAPADVDLAGTAKAFAEQVKAAPITTDYALYSEFRVSPERTFNEIRSVIVSKSGDVAWQDSMTAKDPTFARMNPREPLQCCMLLVDRLRPVFGLDDPMRADAPAGKLAKRWEQATGVPSEKEFAAISERSKEFAKAAATATVEVYRPHAGAGVDTSAAALVQLINESKFTKAVAIDETPNIPIKSDMNEQKVLWSMANGFSAYVKAHPPKSDYVMFADYLTGKGQHGQIMVGGVHFAICNRAGELVAVDFQNSHHNDFQSIDPKSVADCNRLVVRRLAEVGK